MSVPLEWRAVCDTAAGLNFRSSPLPGPILTGLWLKNIWYLCEVGSVPVAVLHCAVRAHEQAGPSLTEV